MSQWSSGEKCRSILSKKKVITWLTFQELLCHPSHVLKYEPFGFQDSEGMLPVKWLAPSLCNLCLATQNK